MDKTISSTFPWPEIRQLNFILGEHAGWETLYPPEGEPIHFRASVSGSREECERFVRIEFYGDLGSYGIESFLGLLSYSKSRGCYTMWMFGSSQEDPLFLTGDFTDGTLVLTSDVSTTFWGVERLRFSITPTEGRIHLFGEIWRLDGWTKYCVATYDSAALVAEATLDDND
jgi:hypothetical protein